MQTYVIHHVLSDLRSAVKPHHVKLNDKIKGKYIVLLKRALSENEIFVVFHIDNIYLRSKPVRGRDFGAALSKCKY